MTDQRDILATLLAAEEHPLMNEEPEVIEARKALEVSPELQKALEDARAFCEKHPVLLDCGDMPDEVRKRIKRAIEQHSPLNSGKITLELSPLTVRNQFGWAAVLVLLLTAMALFSTRLIEEREAHRQMVVYRNQPPEDAFRSYAGQLVANNLPLQEFNSDTRQLVSWMEDRTEGSLSMPEVIHEQEGMGCAILNGPSGAVTLLCMKVENGVIHLFTTDAASLNLSVPSPPRAMHLYDREALQWNTRDRAYLLIAHEPEQDLPEQFL